MTFDKFSKEVKQELGIKELTKEQARYTMSLYLARTSVEEAVKKMKGGK